MSVPQRLRQLQPPRALTSWVVGAITLLAIGAAWIVVDASRADATDFDASLIVAFFIPLVASALCIETLTREAWGNNRRVAPLVFWLWLLVMPLGVYSAAAYLVTLMPISYRGEGAGVWWGDAWHRSNRAPHEPAPVVFRALPPSARSSRSSERLPAACCPHARWAAR